MKISLTRINKGRVSVEGKVIASIDKGLAVFIGLEKTDTGDSFEQIAEKIINLRIFENEEGKLDCSVKDKNYHVLCIPNFTLCADTTKGRRPSFEGAMAPNIAKGLFGEFIKILENKGVKTEGGQFGAHMDIKLDLDGPVNIILNEK